MNLIQFLRYQLASIAGGAILGTVGIGVLGFVEDRGACYLIGAVAGVVVSLVVFTLAQEPRS